MKYNIFNSTIWKSKINYNKKYELIKLIENEYEKNPSKTPITWKCNVHSSFCKEKESIPSFLLNDNFFNIIIEKVNEFLKIHNHNLNIKGQYFIDNCWYNAYKGNQFQEIHTHGGNLFSGCYYLKFNGKYHHQTQFYNPNFNIDYSKLEDNNYFCFTPDCEEDDLIIFPSFLPHGTKGVKNENCEDLRITISFNISNSLLDLNKKNTDIAVKYY